MARGQNHAVERVTRWLRLPATLGLAALLVGIAIVWDGGGARAVNAGGGLLWLGSFAAMARAAWRRPGRVELSGLVLALTLVLAVVVRPSDGGIAILGFGIAGTVVALVAVRDQVAWSVLVPAVWLPAHLMIAVTKGVTRAATGGEATVRTDPPPTTALVPVLMVAAAWGAAILVVWMRGRVAEHRVLARDTA